MKRKRMWGFGALFALMPKICFFALDPAVQDLMTTGLMLDSRESSRLTGMADRNAVQGLTVVQTTVIQSVAASADDGQLFASMRTSDRVPNAKTNE